MSCILCDISGYFELSGFELLRFYSITTSNIQNCFTTNNILLYFDNSKFSVNRFKLLLLEVKMRRIDIPVSEMGRHFQTFPVADEGLGDITCLSAGLHYL